MDTMLVTMENVIFSYKRGFPIFNDFTMQIPKNSIFSILGHNGAGKTTLLRLMAKLIKPQLGDISWGISKNESIGFMPEGMGLYPRLNGYDNIKIRLLAYKKKADKEEVENILKEIDLLEHANKQVGLWSTGMKRRLSLACSLMGSANITADG